MEGLVSGSIPCLKGREKSKDWQMELLMEKLRSKSNQYKSFYESSKTLRMTMLEKRYPIDSVERIQLQKCLDTLQQNIIVTTHQAMVERLESISRHLGLKFVSGPTGLDLFISSDMFYLEIVLENNGGVKDVKIHHEGRNPQQGNDQQQESHLQMQSCEELVTCLTRRDFADFTAQLEGLASIYQINAEKKVKCKAFTALSSLETDLQTLSSLQTFSNDVLEIVHQSSIGYLEKRRGGHAMKLTFFISPYDLLDPNSRSSKKLPSEGPLNIGLSVCVCMESSSAHKLQTAPLVTINRETNWPSFAPLTTSNSLTVAGCFALTLKKPMPICMALINSIRAVTQLDWSVTSPHPLLSLISRYASDGKADSADNKGLFVNVGDQQHCYLMTENRGLEGVLVSSIPFSHPNHVPQIITYLRQQALFNAVIGSCVRPNTIQEYENMIMLEVTALSWQHLSISLEHPVEESMATVELDLSDIKRVNCKVYTAGETGSSSSDYATTVFQRSLSIPVTMRSLIKQWNIQSQRMNNFYNGLGGGNGGNQGNNDYDPDIKIKLEPGLGGLVHQSGFDDSPGGFDSFSGPMDTSELSLTPTVQFCDLQGKNLLSILDGKRRKKKSNESWKSPKDSSSNESTPLGTPVSRDPTEISTPTSNSGLEFSALELDNSTTDKNSELDIEENDDDEDDYKIKRHKKKEEKKTTAEIILDLENRNLVPPSVSITPISSSSISAHNFNSILSGMGLEKRPGIEIIPISSAVPAPAQSSITITPISSKNIPDDRSKDRKRSKDDKNRNDRKRKRKQEDSMGPPEKVPMKSDPLSKPVTVSIKPADSTTSPRPSSPSGSIRKYTSSPTSPLVLLTKSTTKTKQSPKHSPAYGTPSPKSLTSSPKQGTSSPKHQSSSSLGKPSISTLKSAVNSPSKDKKKDAKDKDRKSFSGHSSPKLKSVKLKQVEITNVEMPQLLQTGGTTPPQSGDGGKSSAGQSRIRKGSLSAVIDKLKSAQCGEDMKEKIGMVGKTEIKLTSAVKPGEKPGEYMVKPSSEGIKITINKTRTKDSKRSSGSGSPKTFTQKSSSSSQSKKYSHGQKSGSPGLKSNSSAMASITAKKSSSLPSFPRSLSKGGGSPKTSFELSRKDKSRVKSEKSVFSSSKSDVKKLSPLRDEADFKNQNSYYPPLDGFIKTLDPKFHIPKLSARNNPEDRKEKSDRTDSPKSDKKGGSSPKKDSEPPNISIIPVLADERPPEDLSSLKIELPISSLSFGDQPPELVREDILPKRPQSTGVPCTTQEAAEMLLDFSAPSKPEKFSIRSSTSTPPNFPGSPSSVSVHIVKSPAPASTDLPIVIRSPHSASPSGITDDELMDEALVGIGGK